MNRWVNFTTDPSQTNNPLTLFDTTSPESALAPYFGDHYTPHTTGGYVQSIISYTNAYNDGTGYGHLNDSAFIIQWENLNINYTRTPFRSKVSERFNSGYIKTASLNSTMVRLAQASAVRWMFRRNKRPEWRVVYEQFVRYGSDPIDSVEHSKFLTTVRLLRVNPVGQSN